MNIFTVSFFGHREISNPTEIENRLERVIRDLIERKEYVEFLVGRDGEFDQLVSSTIRRVTTAYGYGNSSHVLVLPYMKAEYRDNEQSFLEYYDEVEVCAESSSAYYKSAILIRNRSMVDRSDLVVCCIQRKSGGAYKTVQYAKQNGVEVCNLAVE
jgi:hypothetical protein